jgi:uncharacterized cofD-like protein
VIYEESKKAIETADFVITGPGDLYSSILPNFVVEGAKEAVKKSKARFIYTMNLMTRYTQTHNMEASKHIAELERYLGRMIDVTIINTAPIPKKLLISYREQHEYPVDDDLQKRQKNSVLRQPLIRESAVRKHSHDIVPRSYLRHDPAKLRKVFQKILT